MNEKRYLLVKCIPNHWGIVDRTLEGIDQLILMHHSKLTLNEIVDELNEKEQLEKENKELKLLVQNWEQLDDEKDEQLEKMNDSLKRFVEENKQLQQELFDSEYECICVHYHDNPIRRDNRIEDLKEEFKERFGRDFE